MCHELKYLFAASKALYESVCTSATGDPNAGTYTGKDIVLRAYGCKEAAQSINQPTNQSTNQLHHQSINRSSKKQINQTTKKQLKVLPH